MKRLLKYGAVISIIILLFSINVSAAGIIKESVERIPNDKIRACGSLSEDDLNTKENGKLIKNNDEFTSILESKNDVDFYKLQSTVYNSWNQCKLVNNGTSELDFIIYNSDGEVLDDTIVKSNSCSYLNNKMEVGKIYYISVSCNWFSKDDVGNYQISYQEIIDDVADCPEDGKDIKINKNYKQNIEVPRDLDIFWFKPKSSKCSIYLKNETNANIYISVNGNHDWSADTTVSSNKSKHWITSLNKNEWYYIRVVGYSNGKYTIKVEN